MPACGLLNFSQSSLVILINLSQDDYSVNFGDRICQMVIHRYEQIEWQPVEILEDTTRGAGGFGHTGSG